MYPRVREQFVILGLVTTLLSVVSPSPVDQLRRVIALDRLPTSYFGSIATFGDPLSTTVRANLMVPPDDSFLCQRPTALQNFTEPTRVESESSGLPIALFVSIDGCSPEQKARVALDLRKNVNSLVQYLLVYSPIPSRNNTFLRLMPDSPDVDNKYAEIGIIYMPYEFALGIATQMRSKASTQSVNPAFMAEGNELWQFLLQIEMYDPLRGDYNNTAQAESFYWFRFVLFSLLIISPCLRAGYLWYAGGGRFIFQRNERGRIVGLQYVPPIPYWLTAGRFVQAQRHETLANTLNEEQFLALPEIEYKEYVNHDGDGDADASTSDEADESVASSAQENAVVANKNDVFSFHNEEVDVEQALGAPTPNRDTENMATGDSGAALSSFSTTCTMCSICIDDFEANEKLVLLPKCQHAFHKECIHPWLTERQGCCPLCKTEVVEQRPGGEGSPSASVNDSSSTE